MQVTGQQADVAGEKKATNLHNAIVRVGLKRRTWRKHVPKGIEKITQVDNSWMSRISGPSLRKLIYTWRDTMHLRVFLRSASPSCQNVPGGLEMASGKHSRERTDLGQTIVDRERDNASRLEMLRLCINIRDDAL